MEVLPPQSLKKPLVIPYTNLMRPGPSSCPPRVLHAVGQPVLSPVHPKLFEIMDEIKEGIRYILQTKNELTFVITGSGNAGMEASLCNLIEKGDKVLIAQNGFWGIRAADMAARHGAVVTKFTKEFGDNYSLDELESKLKEVKPKVLFIVHGESSTGVYQPLEGLGSLCHRYNCLLVVDAVASCGGLEIFVDRWEIDVIYAGSQKVISAPPGLAPISFSPRALDVILNRKTTPPVYYYDAVLLGQHWFCFKDTSLKYHHTFSSNLLYGLREGLAMIVEEGLENVIKRHKRCSEILVKGLEELGLELQVKDVNKRFSLVTTLFFPEDVEWRKITNYIENKYSLEISEGLGVNAIRIGIMGYSATEENVTLLLRALKEALEVERNKKV